jgi:hypothetical protein
MLHQAVSGGNFTDVTNATQPDGFLCGNVSSLSVFVLAVNPSISTTTTTTPGGGTTTTTLPGLGCTEPVACIDAALGTPLCGEETINPKLQTALTAKLGKAKSLIAKAQTKPSSKTAKFLKKIGKQLSAARAKTDAFVSKKKGPISPAFRDSIQAVLAQIEAALAANPPTGTAGGDGGGNVGAGVRATISGKPRFQGSGFYDAFFATASIQGCETFSSSDPTCRRVVTIAFDSGALATPGPATGTYVTYSESVDAPQDRMWASIEPPSVEVLGVSDGRLRGRFSGTLLPSFDGDPTLTIDGTFNVTEQRL